MSVGRPNSRLALKLVLLTADNALCCDMPTSW